MKSKIFSEILSEVTPEIESKVEQKTLEIMKVKKENSFLDLSKLSNEQVKSLPQVFENAGECIGFHTSIRLNSGKLKDDFVLYFNSSFKEWCLWNHIFKNNTKTELTYPEFIKLFEGGEDYPGKQYQPLFDHLNNEHGLILHESEMDEIIRIVGGLNSNQ